MLILRAWALFGISSFLGNLCSVFLCISVSFTGARLRSSSVICLLTFHWECFSSVILFRDITWCLGHRVDACGCFLVILGASRIVLTVFFIICYSEHFWSRTDCPVLKAYVNNVRVFAAIADETVWYNYDTIGGRRHEDLFIKRQRIREIRCNIL